MGLIRHLTYSNVMATIAVFLALGGGAYAISLPKSSVGPRELKQNAVMSAKVKNHSLSAVDLQRGLLQPPAGVTTNNIDPGSAPGAVLKQVSLATVGDGSLYVVATLSDPFLSCSSAGPCSARWGVFVDNRPVPDTGLALQAGARGSDGISHQTLFGVTPKLRPGPHSIKLGRVSSGAIESVGQLGSQVGAFAPAG